MFLSGGLSSGRVWSRFRTREINGNFSMAQYGGAGVLIFSIYKMFLEFDNCRKSFKISAESTYIIDRANKRILHVGVVT